MKEVVSRKKDARLAMCWSCTEENNERCESMKHKAREAVSRTIGVKAGEVVPTELRHCPHGT